LGRATREQVMRVCLDVYYLFVLFVCLKVVVLGVVAVDVHYFAVVDGTLVEGETASKKTVHERSAFLVHCRCHCHQHRWM